MAKTEAKIISKPDSSNNGSASANSANNNSMTTSDNASAVTTNSDVISSSIPSAPIVNSISGKDTENVTQTADKNTEQVKDFMTPKEPLATKKPNRNIVPPKIGLYNRTNYNLHVVFKNEDILFPPRKRTEKIYKENEIVSVQGKSLQTAIATGLISIVR